MAVYLSPVGLSAAQVPNRVSLLATYKERLCRRICENSTNQPEAFVTYKTGTPIFNGTTVFVPVIATVTVVTPGCGCQATTQVIVAEHVSKMMVNANGQQHSWTASQVKKSMESLGLSIPGKVTTGDVTYAANMAYADFYPDPLKDEAACLRYAHKVANDPDGYDGMIFCRWTADAIGKAIKLDWEKFA